MINKKIIMLGLVTNILLAQKDPAFKKINTMDKNIIKLLYTLPDSKKTINSMKEIGKKLIAPPEWVNAHQELEQFLTQRQIQEMNDPAIQTINKKIEAVNTQFMADLERQKQEIKQQTGRDVEFKVRPPQELTDLYKQKENLLDPDNKLPALQRQVREVEQKYTIPGTQKKLYQVHQELDRLLDENPATKTSINNLMAERSDFLHQLYVSAPNTFYAVKKIYPQFATTIPMPFEELLLAK